jgi:hypothetical protein
MFDVKLAGDCFLFLNGLRLKAVEEASISYSNGYSVAKILGNKIGVATQNSPTQTVFSFSKILNSEEDLLNYISGKKIKGSIQAGSRSYGFDESYLESYSVNCAVGSLPKSSVSLNVFDGAINDYSANFTGYYPSFFNRSFETKQTLFNGSESYSTLVKPSGIGWFFKNNAYLSRDGGPFHTKAKNGNTVALLWGSGEIRQTVEFPYQKDNVVISFWATNALSLSGKELSLYVDNVKKQELPGTGFNNSGVFKNYSFSGVTISEGFHEISIATTGAVVDNNPLYATVIDNIVAENDDSFVSQGDIIMQCDNSTTNRIVGIDYSIKSTNTPVYCLGSVYPRVRFVPPLEYSCAVQMDLDDTFISNSADFISNKENKLISVSIKGNVKPKNNFVIITGSEITWTGAKKAAENLGGRLAVLDTFEKQRSIRSVFTSEVGNNKSLWIGARNTGGYGWRWLNDSLVEDGYTNWGNGEPNNYSNNEFYAGVWFKGQAEINDYIWNDFSLNQANAIGYIVEFLTTETLRDIQTIVIPKASLVSEQMSISSQGSLRLNLTYQGHS